jgi:hypothetical protein
MRLGSNVESCHEGPSGRMLMKKALLFVSVAVVAFSATGCKSDIEKAADEVCECKDEKCIDEVGKKWDSKMPKGADPEKMKDMSEKDQAAMKKMIDCMSKAMK